MTDHKLIVREALELALKSEIETTMKHRKGMTRMDLQRAYDTALTALESLTDTAALVEKLEADKFTEDMMLDGEMDAYNAALDAAIALAKELGGCDG